MPIRVIDSILTFSYSGGVLQGQRIGYIRVSSFDQNPDRQLEQIEVGKTFTDKASGKEQSIKITHSSGLSDAEVEKMRKDAKEHEGEDKRKREEVDTKNHADSLIFQTEKQMKAFGEKLTPDMKGKLEAALGRLKEAAKGTNTDEIKSATEALNTVWNEASTQMYSQATGTPGAGGEGANPNAGAEGQQQQTNDDKKVENADFEVIDDEKK